MNKLLPQLLHQVIANAVLHAEKMGNLSQGQIEQKERAQSVMIQSVVSILWAAFCVTRAITDYPAYHVVNEMELSTY